ncbi:hypothetical protein D9M71_133440 [compost metagenome]
MSRHAHRFHLRGPRQQHGAIGLMAALTLGLALLFMVVVLDSGRLYMEQRSLQRVADMAALEAANARGTCIVPDLSAHSLATAAASRNGFVIDAGRRLETQCGSLQIGPDHLRVFIADATKDEAIRVVARYTVSTSIAAGVYALAGGNAIALTTQLAAQSVAASPGPPLAMLNIRSSLVSIDSANSLLLNTLFTALLGSQVNLSLAQWDGLLKTNINLLNYFDALAVELGVSAGDYNQLLASQTTATHLINAMITTVTQNGPLANVSSGLGKLQVGASNSKTVKLGEVFSIANGTPKSGLDAQIQLFQLVQAFVQLANSKSAAAVDVPASVLGLADLTTKVQIIQPPQFSVVGNPKLAKASPTGANKIYVRTAQIRVLITARLNVVSALAGTINLLGALLNIHLLPDGLNLDVGLEVASANSYVTDYDCTSAASKSLSVRNEAAAVNVRIGKLNASNFLSSTTPAIATPMVLISVGALDVGLGVNSPVFSNVSNYTFQNPPDLNKPSANHISRSDNIVNSLSATLSGITLSPQIPLVSTILTLITGAVSGLLSSLLDPIINNLLALLGVDLAKIDVGANLSCQSGRTQLML